MRRARAVRIAAFAVAAAGLAADAAGAAQVLFDPFMLAMRKLGLERNGDVVVIDRELRLRWRGTVAGADEPADAPTPTQLAAVVDAVVAGAPIPIAPAGPRGGVLAPEPRSKSTCLKDVLPIVVEQCAACHRPDGVGPMDLTDYDEARGWAPMMAEVTTREVMPPWSADPRRAACRNERRLTDTDKEHFRRFAADGTPFGELLPGGSTYEELRSRVPQAAWTIGEPDVVWELPKLEEIPAEGALEYRSALIKTGLAEEAWIEAFECRPTAPRLRAGRAGGRPHAHRRPLRAGAGAARGARNDARDAGHRPRAGRGGGAGGRAQADREADRDLRLPVHMRARGVGFRYEVLHEGKVRTLFDVPRFDWNWQHFYDLAEPIRIEAGDVLGGIATYDNSAANPRNPDPKARVRNGKQSSDEMMNGFVHYLDAPAAAPAGARDAR